MPMHFKVFPTDISEMKDDNNDAIDKIHDEVAFWEEKEIEEISNGAIVILLSKNNLEDIMKMEA